MNKYEYMHKYSKYGLLHPKDLNEFGNNGWELVSIIKTKEIECKHAIIIFNYYFKREVFQT